MKCRVSSLSLVVILLFCFKPSPASICWSTPTVPEAFKNSKVVFAGRVVARLKYGVRFRVEKSWKGDVGRYIYIFTGNARNDADPWFERGERWLVYASEERVYESENGTGPYRTKLMARACSRTVGLPYATKDLEELGEGKQLGARASRRLR